MSGQFFPGSCGDLNPAVVVVCTCRKEALPAHSLGLEYMYWRAYRSGVALVVVLPL